MDVMSILQWEDQIGVRNVGAQFDTHIWYWCVQELQKMLKTPVPKVWARYMMCIMRGNHQRDFLTKYISARMDFSWPKMGKNGQI